MGPGNPRPLESRTAIVTGSGRGIGSEEALALARLGANVIVNDIGCELDGTGHDVGVAETMVSRIVEAGGKATLSRHDVTQEHAIDALMELALDTYGSVDIVVNNAGYIRHGLITEMSIEDFDAVICIHLRAPYLLSRAAAIHWRDIGDSANTSQRRIINTSSLAGLWPAMGDASYSTAKCGIYALSMILAEELPPFGATCNVIAPHGATRMNGAATASQGPQQSSHRGDRTKNVAAVVAWLATDACRGVNGQVLHIQGTKLRRIEGFRSAAEIETGDLWTYESLVRETPHLFSGVDSADPAINEEILRSFYAFVDAP